MDRLVLKFVALLQLPKLALSKMMLRISWYQRLENTIGKNIATHRVNEGSGE